MMARQDGGHETRSSAMAGLRATDDDSLDQALADETLPFFPGAGREQLLTQLAHWSRYGNGILIVEGSEQSGKSTLASELEKRLSAEMTLLSICASSEMQSADLLVEIAHALGMESGLELDEEDLLEKIEQVALEVQADASAVAIVIDDAHELDQAGYHLLFKLAFSSEDRQPLISIILLCLPGIDLWRHVPEGMAWPTLAVLRPLDFDEALEFWRHCRQYSGGSAVGLEDSRAARRLWAEAEGLPGELLRRFPDKTEVNGPAAPGRNSFLSLPSWHLLAIVAVGLLLAGVLWLSGRDKSTSEQQSLSIALPKEAAAPAAPAIPSPLPPAPESTSATAPALPPLPSAAPSEPPPMAAPPLPAVPESKVAPAPLPPKLPKVVEKPKPAPVKEAGKEIKPTAKTAPPAAAPTVAKPKTVLAAPSLAQQHQKLLALAPEKFTLQLLGSSDLRKVLNYIDHELGCKDCYYFETRRQGKPWFTVVKGAYTNRAAAVAARERLPAKVKAQQPWPRSLREIQQEIRRE